MLRPTAEVLKAYIERHPPGWSLAAIIVVRCTPLLPVAATFVWRG